MLYVKSYFEFQQCVYFVRSQNKDFLKLTLPEDARQNRNRRVNISIQMTFLTWSLELITGTVSLSIYFILGHDDSLQAANTVLALLTHFLHFIVIPGAYNSNNEVFKEYIFKNGWLRLRSATVPENIEPIITNKNNNIDPDKNIHRARNIPPLPTGVISEIPRRISVSKELDLEVVSVE